MQGVISPASTGPSGFACTNSQRVSRADVIPATKQLSSRFSSVNGLALSTSARGSRASESARLRIGGMGVRAGVEIQEKEGLTKSITLAPVTALVQTLQGRLVLSKKDLSQLPLPGSVEGTAPVHLQLVSVSLDPNGEPKVSAKATLEKIVLNSDGSLSPHSREIMANEEEYSVAFKVPEDFGEVGAFKIWSEYENEIFIHSFVLTLPDHSTTVEFRCQSWVFNEKNYQLERFFFSNKVYLPEDTPKGLKELRKLELQVLRGEGPGQNKQERKLVDRIYDYDIYNDLGDPDNENGPVLRPPLGGSKDLPFPRRIRTGRPRSKNDLKSESRETVPDKPFYIPADERFYAMSARQRTSHSLVHKLKRITRKRGPSRKDAHAHEAVIADTVDTAVTNGKQAQQKDEWESLQEILGFYGLAQLPVPQVIAKSTTAWMCDEEYGREALAGLNPQVIKRVKKFPPEGSSITEGHIKPFLKGKRVHEVLDLLFTIDHTNEFLPYIEKINSRQPVKAYAPRSLFYWDSKIRRMVPIAIELSLSEGGKVTSRVFTPPHGSEAPDRGWEMAKIHASSIDFSYHEVYSHFVRTHACMEPVVLASNRHLSRLHPIYNFVLPLFKNTLNINSGARQNLIPALGYIESFFTPGEYSMEMGSKLYGLYWRFDKESLPVDLIERGFAEKCDGHPGGVKFIANNLDYPYAEDGLEIWDALNTYVSEYVRIAYNNDHDVGKDFELQSWWKEIKEVGHADKKEGWPELKSRADLVHILTTIAWVAGPQHAAVNFGQYAYAAFPPNRTTLTRRFIPKEGSGEYKDMLKDPEKFLLSSIANYPASAFAMNLLLQLSTHAVDEEYIGQRHDKHWTSDPRVKIAFTELNARLRNIELKQQERNKDPERFNRRGAVQVPYTLLYPTSPTAGVTGQGVPNSISI